MGDVVGLADEDLSEGADARRAKGVGDPVVRERGAEYAEVGESPLLGIEREQVCHRLPVSSKTMEMGYHEETRP